MNLRDLRYFVALAETRHFGRAAESTFVSQPTLSGQIHKLEEELGVALFERTTKSVALTPLGVQLLAHARAALEQADTLAQTARAHRDPLAGPLRLGAIPTIAPYLVPLILGPLKRRYPALTLVLFEEITAILLERLRHHEIDAAIIATPVTEAELDARPLFDEPFWLGLPRDHPLTDKERITRHDLESLQMLLLADGHCLAEQAREVCRLAERRNRADQNDLRAASLETLLQLVGAGMGATLVPALATRGAWITDAGVLARPLELRDAKRLVSLAWRRSFPRMPVIEALAEVIVANLPNTVQPKLSRAAHPSSRNRSSQAQIPPRIRHRIS
jgi:LysR family transcriptional regulator, hydrogen peroxide-inducible genes activator